jgi:hypothetical protein
MVAVREGQGERCRGANGESLELLGTDSRQAGEEGVAGSQCVTTDRNRIAGAQVKTVVSGGSGVDGSRESQRGDTGHGGDESPNFVHVVLQVCKTVKINSNVCAIFHCCFLSITWHAMNCLVSNNSTLSSL